MTTAERKQHLTYPDHARLRQRLADANEQRLVLFDISQQQPHPRVMIYRSFCTPSERMDPYAQWIHWDIPNARAYTHCTCTAGAYGVPCKHVALFLDVAGLLDETMAHRTLDAEEYQRYETLAILPEWEKENDENPRS